MLRKLLVLFLVMVVFGVFGCKKHPEEKQADNVRPISELQTEAKQNINEENMYKELSKIEKEIEQELSMEE